jgi:cytochrome P450
VTTHNSDPPRRAQVPCFDDPAFIADPYPGLKTARDTGVHRDDAGGCWWATRYADVNTVLRSGCFKDPHKAGDGPYTRGVMHMRGTLMFMDAPDHTRLRGLVSGAFPPRVVEALRPRVQELAEGLLAAVTGDGFELMTAFARPLPAMVIAEVIGVDPDDRDQFLAWSDDLAHSFDPFRSPEIQARVSRSYEAFRSYFRRVIAERRAAPRADLVSRLVEARDGSDHLTDAELVAILVEIVDSGAVTTSDLIGNGVLALLHHAPQLQALRADPALIPNAVEEMLRFDTSIIVTERVAIDGVLVAGCPVPAGDWILPSVAAANHDPSVFPDPERFDIARDNAHLQLAFGAGRHVCLGAALARLEAQVAIGALLRAFPALRLGGDGEPRRKRVPGFRGLAALPVRIS